MEKQLQGANKRPEQQAVGSPRANVHPDYTTAAEAMSILKVRPQTLYAYVSRGLLHSIAQTGRKGRLYLRDDLRRLEARSLARNGHGPVAASAMNFGEPIISTSVTEITAEGPRYRGRMAVDLARAQAPFEAVAQLLWTGVWNDNAGLWPRVEPWPELNQLIGAARTGSGNSCLLDLFAMVTLHLGCRRQVGQDDGDPMQMIDAARQIIQTLAGCYGLLAPDGSYMPVAGNRSIAQGILDALSIDSTGENWEGINSLLVLLADHELSPATFAARVAASTGCTLHSSVASAFSASSGALIAGMYDGIDQFLDSASTASAMLRRAAALHRQGMAVPGFDHPLYPHGDPRAKYLLELARRRTRQTRQMAEIYRYVEEMAARHGLLPRHELGVVTMTRAIGMPRQTAAALSAFARVAGWVAHIEEQRMFGTVLRPRARFAGGAP
ncbi:citrate synthase [Caballeronia sp. dw_19]|uniref:citrate synthase n=1 Tax=Caballeronia sp. dw_19 TaxID=2719791 RepID=UPI001BD60CE4|nr:citrate synthase [Caballeronia sp. dw_19]